MLLRPFPTVFAIMLLLLSTMGGPAAAAEPVSNVVTASNESLEAMRDASLDRERPDLAISTERGRDFAEILRDFDAQVAGWTRRAEPHLGVEPEQSVRAAQLVHETRTSDCGVVLPSAIMALSPRTSYVVGTDEVIVILDKWMGATEIAFSVSYVELGPGSELRDAAIDQVVWLIRPEGSSTNASTSILSRNGDVFGLESRATVSTANQYCGFSKVVDCPIVDAAGDAAATVACGILLLGFGVPGVLACGALGFGLSLEETKCVVGFTPCATDRAAALETNRCSEWECEWTWRFSWATFPSDTVGGIDDTRLTVFLDVPTRYGIVTYVY